MMEMFKSENFGETMLETPSVVYIYWLKFIAWLDKHVKFVDEHDKKSCNTFATSIFDWSIFRQYQYFGCRRGFWTKSGSSNIEPDKWYAVIFVFF